MGNPDHPGHCPEPGETAFLLHAQRRGAGHRPVWPPGGNQGLRRPRGLEILPYVQSRAEFVPIEQNEDVGFENPYRDGSDFFYGAGFDLKYGLSSSLTLNATINPDFGQVEVDPAVVNLTAFETRFEEKRPFFVEGAGIFSFGQRGGGGGGGGMMRMMGGAVAGAAALPSSSIPGASASRPRGRCARGRGLQDVPDATTILGAAKLTGQTANGWSIGLMEAVTGREMADYVDDSGSGPGSRGRAPHQLPGGPGEEGLQGWPVGLRSHRHRREPGPGGRELWPETPVLRLHRGTRLLPRVGRPGLVSLRASGGKPNRRGARCHLRRPGRPPPGTTNARMRTTSNWIPTPPPLQGIQETSSSESRLGCTGGEAPSSASPAPVSR